MAKLIGHIGAPHGPYRFSDVRCERKGFLSIFTFLVDSMSYRIEMMDRGHAVVVLPVDFSKGTLMMIRQPRFNHAFLTSAEVRALQERAAQAPGREGFFQRLGRAFALSAAFRAGIKVPALPSTHADVPADDVLVYEMPAGMIDRGESEEHAALRELHEETGILIDETRLVKVSTYFPSLGGTTERITAYIADISGCVPDLTKAGDGEESIDVWELTFDETFSMLQRGELHSASCNIMLRELRIRLLESGFVAT